MTGKPVRNSISKGIAAIRAAGPIGWVVVVAIAALALAGFAIHAIVIVATTRVSGANAVAPSADRSGLAEDLLTSASVSAREDYDVLGVTGRVIRTDERKFGRSRSESDRLSDYIGMP